MLIRYRFLGLRSQGNSLYLADNDALSCLSLPPTGGSVIGLKPESQDELRKRLREMSDHELRRFGQRVGKLATPEGSFGTIEPYAFQLEEAHAEWRRRHPSGSAGAGRTSRLPSI